MSEIPYSPTTWVNGGVPALNATNLNHLTNELKSQATTQGIANQLPTWVNGSGAALSDAVVMNELERVTYQVGLTLGLNFSGTQWFDGWTPARNATRLNLLEQGAFNNRAAMDAIVPPSGTLFDQLSDFYFQPWGGTYLINAYQRTYPANGYQLLGSGNQWPAQSAGHYPGFPALSHGSYFGVVETSTIHGAGFYVRCWPEQVHGAPAENDKSCFITDENHIWPDSNVFNASFIGKTTDVQFWFMLPASGNPNGFSDFSGWNCLMEYHPGGPYAVNNQLGVDPQTSTVYVRVHDGNNVGAATPGANYGRRPLVLDHWYQYRRLDTWSRTSGTTQAWIDGVQILNQSGVGNVQANLQGSDYAQCQPNFGFYTGGASTVPQNEVYFADMRFTVT